MSSTKLKTALDNMTAAEKALKTSMFKWSPDYDTAASEYTKAATNFKLAGSPEKAKDAYVKASQMQERLGSLFHAAKLLTQAAGIASDLKKLEEAVSLMERACSLYREHGAPDTAALTISKAGKMCEQSLPNKSTELYLQAAELCEADEKLRDASDYLNNAIRMELKRKRYLESTEIMKRRIELLKSLGNFPVCYQVTLGLVIAYLAAEDYVMADKAYKDGFELGRFAESDEAMYSEQFLKAYEEGDVELLNKTKTAPMVTHMDTELARLARTLQITDDDVITTSKNSPTPNLTTLSLNTEPVVSESGGVAIDNDEDDDDDDLC